MPAPQLRVGKYNPNAYVPGGAPVNVAKAIQTQGFGGTKKPVTPTGYDPSFFGGTGAFKGGYLQDPGVGGMTTPDTTFEVPTTYVQPGTSRVNILNPLGPNRPDINALIAGDWEVQDAETRMGQRMASLRGDFTDSVRNALINLGTSDTSKLGKFGSYIDQDTIAKAIANKYSANAQISDSEARSQAQTQAALAGRGILSSGQLTKSTGDIAADAEKSRFDALQQFLSSGETGLRGLGDAESQLGDAIATARANAADRASKYDLSWLDYQNNVDLANNAPSDQAVETPAGVRQPPPPPTPPPPPPAPKPVPKETAAQRALRLRSEALNKRYGL